MCRPGGSNPVIANVEHTKNSDLVLTARRAENKCAKTLKCGAGLGRQGSALFIFARSCGLVCRSREQEIRNDDRRVAA
jgi:hypothetical protein